MRTCNLISYLREFIEKNNVEYITLELLMYMPGKGHDEDSKP